MIETHDALSECYETLEIPEDSSWSEVKKSYLNLKSLYSKPSIAVSALHEETMGDLNQKIIEQIDEAYRGLSEYYQDIHTHKKQKIDQILSEVDHFCGSSLKKVRQELNVDLLDIAISSNIQINHLRNIEEEMFEALPNDVYLRGYLKSYADYISIDSAQVVEDYMHVYQQWKNHELKGNKRFLGIVKQK